MEVRPRRIGLGPKWQMHYVYILKSNKTGRLYKGSTGDLKNRLKEHNTSQVLSTKNGQPWTLFYYEAFSDKRNARREELFLKTGKGRERIKWLFDLD